MTVRTFNHIRFKGDWEWNLIGKHLNIRIGRSQVAVWWNHKPLINLLTKAAR